MNSGKFSSVSSSPKGEPTSHPNKHLSSSVFQPPPPGESGESSDKEEEAPGRFQCLKLSGIAAAVSGLKGKASNTSVSDSTNAQQPTEFSRNLEIEPFPREQHFWEDVVTEEGRVAHEQSQEEQLAKVHKSPVVKRPGDKSGLKTQKEEVKQVGLRPDEWEA